MTLAVLNKFSGSPEGEASMWPFTKIFQLLSLIILKEDQILGELRDETLFVVPHFGAFIEQRGPVVPTPQRKGTVSGRFKMTSVTMSDSQQVTLGPVTFKDKKGNPAAQPGGDVQWLVDNPAILSITPSADGLSAVVKAVGPLGTGTASSKVVDATGSTLAAGSVGFTITGGAATEIEIPASVPSEQ